MIPLGVCKSLAFVGLSGGAAGHVARTPPDRTQCAKPSVSAAVNEQSVRALQVQHVPENCGAQALVLA